MFKFRKNSEKTTAELKQEKKLYGALAIITWVFCGALSALPVFGMPQNASAYLLIGVGASSLAALALGGVATILILMYSFSASFELRVRQALEGKQ